MDDDKVKTFLDLISQIESSGGKDTSHKEMAHGIQAGDAALGQYGLMPNTIYEMAKRQRMKDVLNIPKEELSEKFSPELEQKIADALANRVLEKSGGDQSVAAYRWNMGHNLPPERITPETLESSPYVQKFRALQQLLQKK